LIAGSLHGLLVEIGLRSKRAEAVRSEGRLKVEVPFFGFGERLISFLTTKRLF
jgi:hypothetical protein